MGKEPLPQNEHAVTSPAVGSGSVSGPDGVEIYYETMGEGPAVVLVAGLADDRTSWSGQVPALSEDHLVVVFDNRGIGNSSVPNGPYSIDEMADDAHAVVEELGLGPVSAVGSSMGGAICQRWALRHEDDLERLVLTNTWAERDAFLDVLFSHWIALGENGSGRRIMESLSLFCFSPYHMQAHPTFVEDFLALPPLPLTGFVGAAHACRAHDTLGELRSIAQPTLVVAGEHDILTRPAFSERIVKSIPAARMKLLPAGHMIFWEQPETFSDLVLQFLSEPL